MRQRVEHVPRLEPVDALGGAGRRDLVLDLIEEALEDVALVRSLEEAEGSPLVSRDEVFKILDEPLD